MLNQSAAIPHICEQEITQLRKLLRQQQKTIDASLDVLCTLDDEGVFTSLSASSLPLWGYEPGDLLHKSLLTLLTIQEQPYLNNLLERIRQHSEAMVFETTCLCKEGSLIPVLWSVKWDAHDHRMYAVAIKTIRDGDGQPLYGYGMVQDITQQKKTEEVLQLSEERYRLLFNKAPLAMLIYKVGTWEYVEVNEAALQQYGYSREEFLKLNAFDLRPTEEYDRFTSILPELASKQGYKEFRGYRHRRKNGQLINVDVFTHELTIAGEQHILSIVFDITEKIKLEQQVLEEKITAEKEVAKAIIHTQEIQRSYIAKELHDNVNQILTTTKLYLENIHHYPQEQQEAIQKKCTGFLNEAISEIRSLSSALITPSFYDLGFSVTLLELIEQYRTLRKYDIQEDIVLQEETISEEIKLTAFRIVQEQLNNIVKHAGATKLKVAVVQSSGELWIEVQDNGVGFDPAERRKGLGLSNIQNRAAVFNGTVCIDTALGEGCKLTVKLPL